MSAHPAIGATLEVAARDTVLLARVTFANRSKAPALLYRFNLPLAGRLENNVFAGTVNGGRLRYAGTYVKRRAPSRGDFLELQPGQPQTFEVDLRAFYVLPEYGKLVVRYEAFHDPPDHPGVFLVASNEAVLEL